MNFIHEGLKVMEWEIDIETINLANQLSKLGTGIKAIDEPFFEPYIETLKSKSIPVGWIGINWYFLICGLENNIILKYSAEDRYRINPIAISDIDIKEIIVNSHILFRNEFDLKNKSLRLSEGIRPIVSDEVDQFCLEIIRLLKN